MSWKFWKHVQSVLKSNQSGDMKEKKITEINIKVAYAPFTYNCVQEKFFDTISSICHFSKDNFQSFWLFFNLNFTGEKLTKTMYKFR